MRGRIEELLSEVQQEIGRLTYLETALLRVLGAGTDDSRPPEVEPSSPPAGRTAVPSDATKRAFEEARSPENLNRYDDVDEMFAERPRVADRPASSLVGRTAALPTAGGRHETVADRAAALLEEAGQPLRCVEIYEALLARGHRFKDPHSGMAVVSAALRRRPDLFDRVGRKWRLKVGTEG